MSPHDELDIFMQTLEQALTDLNTHGPYATALAVQVARRAVELSRAVPEQQAKPPPKPPPDPTITVLAINK
jgi:hypothetical protein